MNGVGIASLAIYRPPLVLTNDWFGANMPRKFVQHTGTQSRRISSVDEVAMAQMAIQQLQATTNCDLKDCAGIVFVSPSFIPLRTAKKLLPPQHARAESLARSLNKLACSLSLAGRWRYALNWFCSGYAKAMARVQWQCAQPSSLMPNQFVLVVTAGRISRITDYGCSKSGPLFGDLATATLISRTDSEKYPVRLKLKYAHAEKLPAPDAYFDFEACPAALGADGSRSERVVYRLDGLGIADLAPRAMASALAKSLQSEQLSPADVEVVIPHQAGTGIVRLATMKFEEIGVQAKVINGITSEVGNVSSSSIPFALSECWDSLEGMIACPTAGVGAPGKAEVTQGCLLLERVH